MWFFMVLVALFVDGSLQYPEEENSEYFWRKSGEDALLNAIGTFENINKGVAKNVIMVVGDGMSLGTTTAGRIFMGQNKWKLGEEHVTALDNFPHVGLAKTYSLNYQTPDSASTGTAILCGVKTKNGMIGVTGDGKCDGTNDGHVYSALEKAIKEGKSTGIVTNTRVQHATPAAAYAHITHRRWYSDKRIPEELRSSCKDIALQLYEKRLGIQVILGGGRSPMKPQHAADEENASKFGERLDGRNLIQEWQDDLTKRNLNNSYVWNAKSLLDVDPETTDHLLGLFERYEMRYRLDRFKDEAGEPSLAQMVDKAIRILRKNPKGYFLLVEGGLLDKAHHQGLAKYALQEFAEVDKAIQVARDMTSTEDTLLIATADHGHMFAFGGGSIRGNPVMGLAPNHRHPSRALDRQYYTSIVYGTGPGYSVMSKSLPVRKAVRPWEIYSKSYKPQSAIPLSAGTHSSEDVVVYASGPMAHLIHGVNEQTYIAHVMFYAACLGEEYKHYDHCQDQSTSLLLQEFKQKFFTYKVHGEDFEPEARSEDA